MHCYTFVSKTLLNGVFHKRVNSLLSPIPDTGAAKVRGSQRIGFNVFQAKQLLISKKVKRYQTRCLFAASLGTAYLPSLLEAFVMKSSFGTFPISILTSHNLTAPLLLPFLIRSCSMKLPGHNDCHAEVIIFELIGL